MFSVGRFVPLFSEKISMKSPDVRILSQGTVVLAEPVSSRARCWLVCNPSIERWPWSGSALRVEASRAIDLIRSMASDGLIVVEESWDKVRASCSHKVTGAAVPPQQRNSRKRE